MGIRLDWEIEAEQTTHSAQEDPQAQRARRRARLQLIAGIVFLLALIGGVVLAIQERLRVVEQAEAQVLIDTVTAEIAELRIGNRAAYLEFFRSDDAAWMEDQRVTFDIYQQLKRENQVQLTGQVSGVVVDGQRGRVLVQEIVDGVPYERVQFYWNYPDDGDDTDAVVDGWRRVPPDYRFFWGDQLFMEGAHTQIAYREIDAPVAESVRDTLDAWVAFACAALRCESTPTLQIEIAPEPGAPIRWAAERPWLLRMPSPYVEGARMDMPFDPQRRFEVASLLAERLIDTQLGERQPRYPWDAFYLRQGVASWLVGRFAEINTNSFLIDSLTANYGDSAAGELLAVLQPESNIDVMSAVTGATLDSANLDWRDFLTWRLALENELIATQDYDNFSWLYKFEDPAVLEILNGRFQAGPLVNVPVVIATQLIEPSADGNPVLLVVTQRPGDDGPIEEQVFFELVANVWKRVS